MKHFCRKTVCAGVIMAVLTTAISFDTGMVRNQAQEQHAVIEDGILLHKEQVGEASANGKINVQWQTGRGDPVVPEDNKAPAARAIRRAASSGAFDLREQGLVTKAKDQGNTGICWVFAGLGSVESNILKQNLEPAEALDLSELHTSWFAYHAPQDWADPLYGDGDTLPGAGFLTHGGYSGLFASTLARGSGTQYESAAPFFPGTGTSASNQRQMVKFMEKREALRYASDYQLWSMDRMDGDGELPDETLRNAVKEMVRENGAVDVSYYTPESSSEYYHAFTEEESGRQGIAYYQEEVVNTAEEDYSNHSVLLVGWDDNFPKENFYEECRPSSDGAWLIRNSWGEDWGSDGYFWISYEEPSLCEFVSMQVKPVEKNSRIYQYDGYDIWAAIGLDKDFKAANIFTASKNGTLKAVSFYTLAANVPYEIQIYKNIKGNTPEAGTPVAEAKTDGIAAYSGYHTVELPEEVALETGERFSVVITYRTGDSGTVWLPVEGDGGQITNAAFPAYSSSLGQSYVCSNGEWLDMHRSIRIGGETMVLNNLPVKALTVDDEKQPAQPGGTTAAPGGNTSGNGGLNVTGVNLLKSKVTLGKGEKYQMQVTVRPASYKGTLQYTSAKKTVATVSGSGVVQAKKTGSTVIRVSAPNGKAAQMTVTVKKAPKKILIKKAKRSLKVKKTDRIKVKLRPKKSASYKLTYKSSKKKVAAVSATGVVKAKKKGKTVITVSTYNKKKVKYILRVK